MTMFFLGFGTALVVVIVLGPLVLIPVGKWVLKRKLKRFAKELADE